MEQRFLQATEVRTVDPEAEGQPKQLTGYAAVFNVLADIGGRFQERIAPGAFRASIQDGDVRALWNHNSDFPLGRTKAGTLRLVEDDKGLRFENDLPDTSMGEDAQVSIQRGDVTGVSFGFDVPPGGDEWAMIGGKKVRTITKVNLHEISPVTFPAYEATSVEARSAESVAQEAERRLAAAEGLIDLEHRRRLTRLAEIA